MKHCGGRNDIAQPQIGGPREWGEHPFLDDLKSEFKSYSLQSISAHFQYYRYLVRQQYRTEPEIGTSNIVLKRAESDIISDIGINFYPLSNIDIPLFTNQHSGWVVMCSLVKSRGVG